MKVKLFTLSHMKTMSKGVFPWLRLKIIDSNNNNNQEKHQRIQCKQMSPTKLNTSDKLMSAAALLNPNLSVKLVSACAHCDVKEKPTNIRSSFWLFLLFFSFFLSTRPGLKSVSGLVAGQQHVTAWQWHTCTQWPHVHWPGCLAYSSASMTAINSL